MSGISGCEFAKQFNVSKMSKCWIIKKKMLIRLFHCFSPQQWVMWQAPDNGTPFCVSTQSSHLAWVAAECVCVFSSLRSCLALQRMSGHAVMCFLSHSASAAHSCSHSFSSGRWAVWPTAHWRIRTLAKKAVKQEGEVGQGEESLYWMKYVLHLERSVASLHCGCCRYAALNLRYKFHFHYSDLR